MAPPRNLRRRQVLTDAAIEILGTSGIHELSHRAVDERTGVPAGTTSNYFRNRDDLLEAVTRRVIELHLADMTAAGSPAGTGAPIGPEQLAEMIGASLYDAATRRRVRFLAIYELSLEATRRPALMEAMSDIARATLDFTIAYHRALGLKTSPEQVHALMTLFGGALFTLVTGPPEAVTPEAALAMARSLVQGVLATVAGSPG
jgi:DNA-binding transcriptional regulator YbjK